MSNQQTPVPIWASIACGSIAGSVAEVKIKIKNKNYLKDPHNPYRHC